MVTVEQALNELKSFFDEKAKTHGATFKSVDWNSPERQKAIFHQLMKIWAGSEGQCSVLDFGCGYGALLDFILEGNYNFSKYVGYDFSSPMIENAVIKHLSRQDVVFTSEFSDLLEVDYVIASGILSMKKDASEDEWRNYCFKTLDTLWNFSKKGMAFNSLTSYSEAEKMRGDLYYADPCHFFDHCKKRYSRNVALLHDYGLYEFTILVRR